MKDNVNLEGPKQSNIESREPTDLRSSTSEIVDSTASTATPPLLAFTCGRAAPAAMRTTPTTTSFARDVVVDKSPHALHEGTTPNLTEAHVEKCVGSLLSGSTPTPSAMPPGTKASRETSSLARRWKNHL